jgi:hypothetical protein
MNTLAVVALFVGCGDKPEETGPTGTSGDPFLFVTDEIIGDASCYTPGDPWLTQSPDPAKQVSLPATVDLEDFEDGCCVPDVKADVWLSDDANTTADLTSLVSGADGKITGFDLPACTPITYRTWTDPALDATKDTYEAHQVSADDGTGSVVTQFNSVSATTYDVVAAVLGVSIDADRSIIAGTVYGCDEEPIEAAQVIVVDDAGNRPDGLVIHYMVDEFPDRDQPWTSEDGLWVALDVPAGDWTIEAWGVVGGTLQQIGATKLRAEADSINISNIYVGYGDGVKYPDACLTN